MYCISATYKGCRSKRVSFIIVYNGKGYYLTGHSEKGYQFQNGEHTVQGKFCSPLFTHRYTVDQQAPPGAIYKFNVRFVVSDNGVLQIFRK